MADHVSQYFTMPGRILVLLTIVLAIGGTWVYLIVDLLPAGRYPIFMFSVPIYLGAGLFFLIGRFVLKCFGYSVLIKEEETIEDDSGDTGD
jgi:hypothetical protein